MVELPFYHIFSIINKMKRGDDITNDDIAKLVGSPGYNMMKLLDHNLSQEVFARGPKFYNRVPAQIRRETPYQTRHRYRTYRRKRYQLFRKRTRFSKRRRSFS